MVTSIYLLNSVMLYSGSIQELHTVYVDTGCSVKNYLIQFRVMDVHEAVRQLRASLELSQQAFATRLDLSISTVQKYEKDRVPDLRSLIALWNQAITAGEYELTEVFFEAIRNELWIVPELLRGLFYVTSAPRIGDAIRRLREKVGSSEKLASLVGWPAVQDVVRWEKQPPGGLYMLIRLAVVAKAIGDADLERTFRTAADESVSEMNTQSLDIRNAGEWAVCKAALLVLHDADDAAKRQLLDQLLPVAEAHLRTLAYQFSWPTEFLDAYLGDLKAIATHDRHDNKAPKKRR